MMMIIVCICTVLYYKYLGLEKEHKQYEEQLMEAKERLEKEENREKKIPDYKAYVQTKQFVEEVARKKFGLVYPDEIIFKVSDGEVIHSTIVEDYDAEYAIEQAKLQEEKRKQEELEAKQGKKPADNSEKKPAVDDEEPEDLPEIPLD